MKYEFVSPGASAGNALQEFLVKQQALKRQAMLDAMTKKVQEAQIANSTENTAGLAAQRQATTATTTQKSIEDELSRFSQDDTIPPELKAKVLAAHQESLLKTKPAVAAAPATTTFGTGEPGTTIGEGDPTVPVMTPAVAAQPEQTVRRATAPERQQSELLARQQAMGAALKGAKTREEAVSIASSAGVPFAQIDDVVNAYMGPKADHSAIFKEYQDALASGYKGDFTTYQNEDANRKKPAASSTNIYNLTDEGLDAEARAYSISHVMPSGIGRNGVVGQRIINRASDPNAPWNNGSAPDLATNKAAYQADTKALAAVQGNYDAVSAFSRNADMNAKILDDVMKEVPNTGIPWLNTPVRALSTGLLGNKAMSKLHAIRQSVQNEYARINSQANLAQVLSDTARKEYESILSPDATPQMIVSALHVLQQESGNRQESYKGQIAEIKDRMKGDHKEKAVAGDNVPVQEWTKDAKGNPIPVGPK